MTKLDEFYRETLDDVFARAHYINWHKLDYPGPSPMYDYLGFQKMFWDYFSGLPIRTDETTSSARALEEVQQARQAHRKPLK